MRNWWTTLYEAKEKGWISFEQMADMIPEGTPAVEITKALNVVMSLGVEACSNVESMPVEQNIREMLEYHKQMTEPEFIDESSGMEEENELERDTG